MSDEDIPFADMMAFAEEQVQKEQDDFDGEIPDHAAKLIAAKATNLLQTLTNIEVSKANEGADDPDPEFIEDAITEDAVDILLALGALKHEHDLDLADAFSERIELTRDLEAFQDKMEDVESQEEVAELFDEHLADHDIDPLNMAGGAIGGGVDIGDNVDSDEYDHDESERGYA